MVKKRPDTEPPEEERPDTTATPLLVEKGKLLPKAVRFTAEKLLRWVVYPIYFGIPSILGLGFYYK
jgi:hypothetical protein